MMANYYGARSNLYQQQAQQLPAKVKASQLSQELSMYKQPGAGAMSSEHKQYLEDKYGIKLPDGFDPTKHSLAVDAGGQNIIFNTSGPQAGQSKGTGVQAWQSTVLNTRSREAQARLQQGYQRLAARGGGANPMRIHAQAMSDAKTFHGKRPQKITDIGTAVIAPENKGKPFDQILKEAQVNWDQSVAASAKEFEDKYTQQFSAKGAQAQGTDAQWQSYADKYFGGDVTAAKAHNSAR
jgi:hypothetical protein